MCITLRVMEGGSESFSLGACHTSNGGSPCSTLCHRPACRHIEQGSVKITEPCSQKADLPSKL